MAENKKNQRTSGADKTKKRKQQSVQKRTIESSAARTRGSRERKSVSNGRNVKRDANPRIVQPNPRRIQKNSKLYNVFIAAIFILIGIVLFLMLFSYSAPEVAGDMETAGNLFGVLGAWIANIMLTLFGIGAFVFSAVSLFMGVRTACGKQFEISSAQIIGLILLILGVSPLAQMGFDGNLLDNVPGGALGKWLVEFGTEKMPSGAFAAICSALTLFGGLLVTDTRFKTFFWGVWHILRWCFKTIFGALSAPFRQTAAADGNSHVLDDDEDNLFDVSSSHEGENDESGEYIEDESDEIEEMKVLSRIVAPQDVVPEKVEKIAEHDVDVPSQDLVDESDESNEQMIADSEELYRDDSGELDDPDNLCNGLSSHKESDNEDDEEPASEAEEEIEPEKKPLDKSEVVEDIVAKIRKSAAPKGRSIKRSHSVPAVEPDFEFESILEPEQLGQVQKTDENQPQTTKTSVLGNWKPRSISGKNKSDNGANGQKSVAKCCESDGTVAGKQVPVPEMPVNVTKDLLAQLASEEISLPSAEPAQKSPTAVTRLAPDKLDTRKIDAEKINLGMADTADIKLNRRLIPAAGASSDKITLEASANNNAGMNDVTLENKAKPGKNTALEAIRKALEEENDDWDVPSDIDVQDAEKKKQLVNEKVSPSDNQTAVPVSAELRSLMEEAGFHAPKKKWSREPIPDEDDESIDFDSDFDSEDALLGINRQTVAPKHGSFVVAEEKKRASDDELMEADKARLEKLAQAEYQFPPLSLLHYDPATQKGLDNTALRLYADKIEEKLAEYHIHGQVVQICPGPIITRFEFQPAPGTKVSKIASLTDDLMMALEIASVRILAPIPGKGVVGIEIPNEKRNTIYLKEILASKAFTDAKSILTIALGKDPEGEPVVSDLAKMPHLLVAGSTGSGKSVGINTMICSLLYNASPDDVKLILVDPKCLELSIYEGIPHLLVPPITTPQETAAALDWACDEMDDRYRKLSALGVRNIQGYNEQVKNPTLPKAMDAMRETDADGNPKYQHMPYIVIVVDEFADLMMTAGKEIERSIARLAQKARAAGIHIILATQRPSTNVITGVIKANFPTRLAFRVFSYVDSRTILDTKGAECLLGMGDSLFLPPNTAVLQRVHGAFVSDDEVQAIVGFLASQRAPVYNLDITTPKDDDDAGDGDDSMAGGSSEFDPLYDKAVQIVAETRQASASFLQRRMSIGFNRAARIIEQMEREGVIGPQRGQKPREVLIQPV